MRKMIHPLIVMLTVFLYGSPTSYAESPDFSTVVGTVEQIENDTLKISIPTVKSTVGKTLDDTKMSSLNRRDASGNFLLSSQFLQSKQVLYPERVCQESSNLITQPILSKRTMVLKMTDTSRISLMAPNKSSAKTGPTQQSAKSSDLVAGQPIAVIYITTDGEYVLLSAVAKKVEAVVKVER